MKQHVTVVPSDKRVIIDGVGYECEFTAHVDGLHALQWHDGRGELEVIKDGVIRNIPITDYDSEVAPYVTIWKAADEIANTPVVLTEEEKAAAVRAERDNLLADTDYMLMPDYPIDEDFLEKIKKYRQKLRDIPLQADFPYSIIWPELPMKG